MKIKILTIHFGVNYGSALQAYALSTYLSDIGHNTQVINYIPQRYNAWYNLNIQKGDQYPKIILLAYYLYTMPSRNFQRKIFDSFLKKNIPMTKRYHSPSELKKASLKADLFIVGSDQVWNYDYNTKDDYSYFFDFLDDKQYIVSYAASFGKEKLHQEEIHTFSKLLSKFKTITVREESGLSIVSECGYDGKHVLDPVFLLSKKQWQEFGNDIRVKDKYVLVYVIDNMYEPLVQTAYQIALSRNCKVYVIWFNKIKDKRVDRWFTYTSPKVFVSLMAQADFVVTNSFHGTAFSIIFERQFYTLSKKNYNTRITSLLDSLRIRNRFIPDPSAIKPIDGGISYGEVTSRLDELKMKSMELLNMIINDAEKYHTENER